MTIDGVKLFSLYFKIHLWRHINKFVPSGAIPDGRGRKGDGSYQKSWLEQQKWICKKCHPPPITKVRIKYYF